MVTAPSRRWLARASTQRNDAGYDPHPRRFLYVVRLAAAEARKKVVAAGLARLAPSKNRFPQQKVFQDELPLAGNEWSTANTACNYRLWPRFGFDHLVQRFAAWAAEKRTRVRRHVSTAGQPKSFLSLIFQSYLSFNGRARRSASTPASFFVSRRNRSDCRRSAGRSGA